MILHSDYRETVHAPHVSDRMMAARYLSVLTFLAGFWYFISPILYFGASEQPNAWNEWVVGGFVLSLATSRILYPAHTTVASWTNAGLGAWMVVSPWICAFSDYRSRTVNSVVLGCAVIGLSLFSGSFTRHLYAYPKGKDTIVA